ncbi:TonB-dependent siderophore receptor [Candidatus Rariloculus sp.]|uniref:TonB-dependent siderophore receptor n=1 Tax=Candidatus Rariloculus sp. TaxID=3101265 RepID=UPI003D0AD0D0
MRLPKAGLASGLIAYAIVSSGVAGRAYSQILEEVIVRVDLRSLPGEDVQSVFGFDRSILETPRSISTISEEMIERFNMRDIDELVAVAPGSFTQSFFGVAGSLDVRGTPGEVYFRGVRRLDNPGNYPTPIGASNRIDVVRGPASPIYGPAKIGGYLNFAPKSARIEATGQFISETTGAASVTTGSWDKSVVSAEIGGPGRLGDRDFGYYLYGEMEHSGSYYDNSGTDQDLLQTSFDMDVSDSVRLQFGGMWHDFSGNQIAGWNRLSQDLVDRGLYVTGAAKPLDADGDGRISHQEYDPDGDGFSDVNPFYDSGDLAPGGALTPGADVTLEELEALVGDLSALSLLNPGIAAIEGHDVLVAPEDLLTNDVTTLYFDIIVATDNEWEWKNQLFYEGYDNRNENAYGFSQFHESFVVEDKLVISKTFPTDAMTVSLQISPSFRFTDFEHGDDYTNEHFDRRDLTGASSPLDARLLATRIDDDYTEYYIGDYGNWGFAFMGDFFWDNGVNLLAGVRYDAIDMQSRQPVDKLLFASANNFCAPPGGCEAARAEDDVDGVSWTLSLSYESDTGLIPYLTASEQSTMILGQGAEVTVGNILGGGAFDQSKLVEAGLKGSLLDDDLYFAVSVYRQERTDFSAQAIVTNQATETEGTEFETRWSVNEKLLLTLGYSRIEVINLNTERQGYRFSFIGCDDLPAIPCHALYGGTLGANVSAGQSRARRAGMPEDIFSVTGTYDFGNGLTISGSVIDVDAVPSGFSNSVVLPAYTLVNLALGYEADNWMFSLTAKNLTGERYFRANFPNLFGGSIVLPELPRHYGAHLQYRF